MQNAQSRSSKALTTKSSTSTSFIILAPIALIFFCLGVYIGSKLVSGEITVENSNKFGLPGTYNVFEKWTVNKEKLRGAVHENNDLLAVNTEISIINNEKQNSIEESDQITNTDINDINEIRKNSFHVTKNTYMKGPTNLDNSNILIGVWIYLDDNNNDNNDVDMRTIFSNKNTGCEQNAEQNGISLYINAWQQNDHKLYFEYGGLKSGCNKLSSLDYTFSSLTWYHVAVYSGI
jgi:hypothetical protein